MRNCTYSHDFCRGKLIGTFRANPSSPCYTTNSNSILPKGAVEYLPLISKEEIAMSKCDLTFCDIHEPRSGMMTGLRSEITKRIGCIHEC